MRGICRAATITIPPNVYVKVSSEQDVEDRLLTLLAKHDLSEKAAPEDIARVRRRLQKARDLDGGDTLKVCILHALVWHASLQHVATRGRHGARECLLVCNRH